MRYDVIVVGAGPAGSTTARECAACGLSVLLLEQAAFPRDKPCGGGVTLRAARLLPFDLKPVAERSIFGIRCSLRRRRHFTCLSPQPLVYLTQRCRLDLFLVEQAIQAGALLRERAPIRRVERHPGYVVVQSERETFEGSALVAADGVNGQTAKRAGLAVGRWMGIALEANITPDRFPDRWGNLIGFDLGDVPGGYSWIFPKGDHLNIGVGGVRLSGSSLRRRLEEIVRFYGFDPAKLWGLRGYPLPFRRPDAPLVDGNLLLVGDAAGLVEPFTGEGIRNAIWSGQAAARHLAAYLAGETRDLQGYRRAIEEELIPELRVSFQLWSLLHLAPCFLTEMLLCRVGRTEDGTVGWTRFSQFLQGEDHYHDTQELLGPLGSALDVALRPSMFPLMSKIFGILQR